MKVRRGFVSNSSSSSFIIAVKPTENCPHCGRGDINVLDMIKKVAYNDDDTEIYAEGIDEVSSYMLDRYSFDAEDAKELEEVKKLAKENYKVAGIRISYHNDTIRKLLDSPNIKIISSDE